MPTCLQSANDVLTGPGYESLTNVFANTITPFSTTTATNHLFRLQSPTFQTVNFTFTLNTPPYNSSLSILRVSGSTAIPIASVNLTSGTTVFTADLAIGQYIICLRSTGNQTGSFIGSFTGYATTAFLQPRGYSGQFSILNELKTKPRERVCTEPLFFELVEGSLPPGLTMDSLGTIRGQLPNLDCLPDPLSPSMNWWYEENDSTLWPWGRQWRFRVDLWVEVAAETRVTEWFCVKVHNNWDFDQAKFLGQAPFDRIEKIKVVEPPATLPKMICEPCSPPTNERVFLAPKPLDADNCPACGSPDQDTSIELIPIPDSLCMIPANELLAWFEEEREGDDTNPEIVKFKKDLAKSESFRILRERAGYIPGDDFTDRQRELIFVTASNYQNFLQLSQVRLNPNANDLAFLVDMWKDQQNQILPITANGHTGSYCQVELHD